MKLNRKRLPYEWLFIVPIGLVISPIGTCFIGIYWKMSFLELVTVMCLQFIAFLFIGLVSNWGE
jgi:hypothetical protein